MPRPACRGRCRGAVARRHPPTAWGASGDIAKKGKDTADSAQVTTEQEVAIGREVAAKMVAYFKVYENPKLAAYVRGWARRWPMQSERQDLACHFELLDTPVVNAFAAPGGFVFVTRGLIENIATEAELAGVLAHEVGHVAARHVVRALQRGKLIQTGVQEARAYMPGSQYLDGVAGAVLERMIDRGLDPGDEYDADQRGVLYAYNAGYRPDGLGMFLETFEKIRAPVGGRGLLAVAHPPARAGTHRAHGRADCEAHHGHRGTSAAPGAVQSRDEWEVMG